MVEEYNSKMPHVAFRGQTPDEMYFGTGTNLPAALALAKSKARAVRIAANRALSCDDCLSSRADPSETPIPP
jgi:putative transposase